MIENYWHSASVDEMDYKVLCSHLEWNTSSVL